MYVYVSRCTPSRGMCVCVNMLFYIIMLKKDKTSFNINSCHCYKKCSCCLLKLSQKRERGRILNLRSWSLKPDCSLVGDSSNIYSFNSFVYLMSPHDIMPEAEVEVATGLMHTFLDTAGYLPLLP